MGNVNMVFSFLTAGPTCRISLPAEFAAMPELSSPLFIYEKGAAREFTFLPSAWDTGPAEPTKKVDEVAGRDGRRVEVLERLEKPVVWYLKWTLAAGSLYTHLREGDRADYAPTVANGVTIVETKGATPAVLAEPPLSRAAAARPGFQEVATFFPGHEGWAVVLTRPGFVTEGRFMQLPPTDAGAAVIRAGGIDGIEVTVTAVADQAGALGLATEVVASLQKL